MMKAFEEKCTRLYDTRLKDYVNQSEDMINQYETQLLQVSNLTIVFVYTEAMGMAV